MSSKNSIVSTLLAISLMVSFVGCSGSGKGNDENNKKSTDSSITEVATEMTTMHTNEISPNDLMEGIKKSLDSLDSLETNIMIYSDIDIKLGKFMQDDLDFDLSKVKELNGKLDEYYTLNNTSDMTIKFDSDSMYMNYKVTEENSLVHELNPNEGISETATEQYLELNGDRILFQCTDGENWESTNDYDLNNISVNPVQTTIELLTDFKPNDTGNIELEDTMVVEGTISSSSARDILENNSGSDERFPAKLIFDTTNNQLKTIKINLMDLYTNEYLFNLMKPSTISSPEEFGKYVKPSRYDIIITFNNANSTSVEIPKNVLETK